MYNSKGIYEWNIDGSSEHEIVNIVHEMMMASTAYFEENEDHLVLQFLIVGFTGVLRGWWENMLNENERQCIKTSVNEEGEQNAVHILIYAITKHLIGDPTILQERSYEIENIRCRTLSDFRWYHDVFVSKAMTRNYASASYWKERFMFGLPKALTKRFKKILKKNTKEQSLMIILFMGIL